MNHVVEPMLDFLQCTLGNRGGTHNHRTAFCAVFFLARECSDRLSDRQIALFRAAMRYPPEIH